MTVSRILRSVRAALGLGAISCVVARPVPAQCRPADDNSAVTIEFLQKIVSAPTADIDWAGRRTDYQLPATTTNKVVLVTSGKACASALSAYKANMGTGEPAPTSVYVVAIGTTHYAVWAPGQPGVDMGRVLILSSKFGLLSSFAG